MDNTSEWSLTDNSMLSFSLLLHSLSHSLCIIVPKHLHLERNALA